MALSGNVVYPKRLVMVEARARQFFLASSANPKKQNEQRTAVQRMVPSDISGNGIQQNPRELENARVFPVGVSPGDPQANSTPQRRSNTPQVAKGMVKQESREAKTPVTAMGRVGPSSDKIPESLSPLHESIDGES